MVYDLVTASAVNRSGRLRVRETSMAHLFERQGLPATGTKHPRAWIVLLVMGATWGLWFSLAKIATAGGAHPIGITFWESLIAGLILAAVVAVRRIPFGLSWTLLRLHVITGLVGVVIPGVAFFFAAAHVPAGILSISVGTVPILTLAASAFLGLEKLTMGRIAGVALGVFAIVMLVGPENSLPEPAQLPWVLLAFAAAGSYAALNMVLELMAPPGANSFALTSGMFAAATLMLVPIVALTGSFVPLSLPWTAVEWSLIGLGAITATAFVLYFYLADYAGPVFVSLTANFVTLFGVIWGIALFDEQNSIWVWASLVTMMGALLLIAPRKRESVVVASGPD